MERREATEREAEVGEGVGRKEPPFPFRVLPNCADLKFERSVNVSSLIAMLSLESKLFLTSESHPDSRDSRIALLYSTRQRDDPDGQTNIVSRPRPTSSLPSTPQNQRKACDGRVQTIMTKMLITTAPTSEASMVAKLGRKVTVVQGVAGPLRPPSRRLGPLAMVRTGESGELSGAATLPGVAAAAW